MFNTAIAGMSLVLMNIAPAVAAQAPVAVQAKPQPNPDRKVCRSEVLLGSRLAKRVCKTQREWQETTQQSQSELRSAVSKSRVEIKQF
jgi:hypothetical protein